MENIQSGVSCQKSSESYCKKLERQKKNYHKQRAKERGFTVAAEILEQFYNVHGSNLFPAVLIDKVNFNWDISSGIEIKEDYYAKKVGTKFGYTLFTNLKMIIWKTM